MPRAIFRILALACALAALIPGAALAVPGPDTVVIVANANIPESVGLAKYYAAQRKVPVRQICALDLPLPPYDPTPIPPGSVWYTKTDVLVASDFQNYVVNGLLACLGERALERIEAAVVMRGVPIQVGVFLPNQPPPGVSFAAALSLWKSTTLDGRAILGQDMKLGEPICEVDQFNCVARWRAPYRNAPTVFEAGWTGVALTEDGVPFTGRPWLVTMLHGLSYGVDANGNVVPGQLGPARGLVDSALAAEAGPPAGKFLFMRNPDDPARSVLDGEYDGVIAKLAQRGFTNAEAVPHSTSLTGQTLASFFVGSVNLGPYDPGGGSSTIEGNTYAPGSLVDNITSTGASPLKFDPNCVCPPVGLCSCYHYPNQPSIARWVAKGVTGVHGTVHEPQSNVFPSRKLILDYVDGATLAEAFFRNLPYVYWKNLVLGDPMAAPYATRPVVTIEDAGTGQPIQEGEDISGTRQVRVEASDPGGIGIASVRLLVGGIEVARANGDTLTACVGADTTGVQLLGVAQSAAAGPLGPGNFKPKGWLDLRVDPGGGPAAAPCPPAMYKAVPGNGAATVFWDKPASGGSAISGYTVTATPGGQTAAAGAGAVSAVVSGLSNGTSYTFTVTAQNSAGSSPPSAASNAVTPAALPGAPTGVSAAAGHASAVVSWTAPASNGGSPITAYTITTQPGALTISAAATATSARVSGLTNGTAYTFTVKATTAAGTGAASAPLAGATPANLPGAPGIGSATLGTGTAHVTWTAPGSDGGSPITGYRVEAIRLIENVAGDGTTDVLAYPDGVAVDSAGAVYIADTGYGLVRKLAGGTLTTVAGGGPGGLGDGGPATSAVLFQPLRLALDGSNLYISDAGHQRVRKVNLSTGVITTVAGNGEAGFGGDGGPGTSAQLDAPFGLAVGGGSLYIADKENHRVRRVDLSSGTITTAVGDGTPGFAGDGGAATAARLWYPEDVALDGTTLYVADSGNGRVRRVSAGGTITTVAGGGTKPFGDGGPALDAELVMPAGIVLDAAHTLTISEGLKSRIRRVDAAGTITTAAGNGTHGGDGDGGSAALAQLRNPRGIALDAAGKLHVADSFNHRIRAVAADAAFATAGAGATAADVGGLRPNTTYTFAVRAMSAIGLSAPSAASNGVTTPGVPGAPTSIVAQVMGTGEVKVTWTPPASDGGSPINGYVITSAPDGISVTVGPTETEALLSGLTAGQIYTFTVIATNAYGPGASSQPSNPVTAGSSIPALAPPALAFLAVALGLLGARKLTKARSDPASLTEPPRIP